MIFKTFSTLKHMSYVQREREGEGGRDGGREGEGGRYLPNVFSCVDIICVYK